MFSQSYRRVGLGSRRQGEDVPVVCGGMALALGLVAILEMARVEVNPFLPLALAVVCALIAVLLELQRRRTTSFVVWHSREARLQRALAEDIMRENQLLQDEQWRAHDPFDVTSAEIAAQARALEIERTEALLNRATDGPARQEPRPTPALLPLSPAPGSRAFGAPASPSLTLTSGPLGGGISGRGPATGDLPPLAPWSSAPNRPTLPPPLTPAQMSAQTPGQGIRRGTLTPRTLGQVTSGPAASDPYGERPTIVRERRQPPVSRQIIEKEHLAPQERLREAPDAFPAMPEDLAARSLEPEGGVFRRGRKRGKKHR